MKKLNENPEILLIENQKVCVLSWFNSMNVYDLYETQSKVFSHFGLKINHYFDKSLTHAIFMDYCLKNIECDIFIFFDLDCVPLTNNIYEKIVKKHIQGETIMGIEQSSQHVKPNFIYAGPACFSITKKLYEKINKPSFDGIFMRSDVAEEISYSCLNYKIPITFFKLISCKNNKWKLGEERYFGNGCYYELEDIKIYHQFQTNLEEQKKDFKLECKKIINNGQ